MYEGPVAETDKIHYCGGYKYQLRADAWFFTGIKTDRGAVSELVELRPDGWLLIRKYFCWDGCSGPTWDDKTNARGCLVHDALYYLMRIGQLDAAFRPDADALLSDFMVRDGAFWIRAHLYERGVNLCGASNVCGAKVRPVLVAP